MSTLKLRAASLAIASLVIPMLVVLLVSAIVHATSSTPCGCWISLEDLPLADIKGLLALGGLSVDPPNPA